MQRKVMISCAVTGSADTAARNPAVPVTPEQIAASAVDAAKAGAAIVHIHVRDPKTTLPSMDGALYAEVVDRIRASGTDVVINLTTGPGGRFAPDPTDPMKPAPGTTLRTPRQRVQHVLDLRPEICSLDMGSMNMGANVFVNTPSILEAMAIDIRDAGVTPELEVFEAGHLLLAKRMIETGHIKAPGMFQICLGISWGQPATPEAMSYMRTLLPADATWFAFGISLHQFPMAAQAVLLGGHVRVGLEDNLYLERGRLTPSNAALVAKAGKIIELLGCGVATPAQAREMLGLGAPQAAKPAAEQVA
jgi:3-dehydrocarnitine:acetyl-CoA trimethylamine transferase